MGLVPAGGSTDPTAAPWPTARADELRVLPGDVLVVRLRLDVSPPAAARLHATLSDDERREAARRADPVARARAASCRARLRALLGVLLGRAPADVGLRAGPHGKPCLSDGAGDLRFNVAHCEGTALVALARGVEVGVDVERVRALPGRDEVARRLFAPAEAVRLAALGDGPDATRAFFEAWTRKEAVGKRAGDGLGHPLDGFALPPVPTAPRGVLLRDGHGTPVWLTSLAPPDEGLVAALACDAAPTRLACLAVVAVLSD